MKIAILSESTTILNGEINKILEENNINSELIFEFDVVEIENHNMIINQFLIEDFFGDKKVIILNGLELIKAKNEKVIFSFLEKLLKNDNNNLLIIKLKDEKSKIVKLFENSNNIKLKKMESLKNKDLVKYVNDNINFDLGIDEKQKKNLIEKIIKLSNKNFDLISKEIEKYKLYDSIIDEEIIINNTYDITGETIFKFMDDLLTLDFDKIKNGFESMKKKAISITFVLEVLVNEFSLLSLVYKNDRYKLNIESKYIHKAPFKVIKANKDIKKINHNILFKFYDLFIEFLILSKTNSEIDLYEIITYKIFLILNY